MINQTETALKMEIVRLQNLVYRMALMMNEYQLTDVDIEAKALLAEADALADSLGPEPDRGRSEIRKHLRLIS